MTLRRKKDEEIQEVACVCTQITSLIHCTEMMWDYSLYVIKMIYYHEEAALVYILQDRI